ncbi:MAG: SAM-dependent methyltransferase [Candidatus Sulfobium sp.]
MRSTIIFIVMDSLKQKIIKTVRERGPMTFEQFMEAALYDAEFGYYMSGAPRIGREGDFFTGSHLHPAFGAMIGRQIEEMWTLMGKPGRFTVVEPGPGEGRICKDMLNSLKDRKFFNALSCFLVERTPSMKERQEAMLAGFREKVTWYSSLEDVGTVTGCVFSNELIDAFPVHLVVMEDSMKEVYIGLQDDGLRELTGPLSVRELVKYFAERGLALTKGYRTEVNLRAKEWLHSVSERLKEGFVLTIDYGYAARDYFSGERDRGTIMCYYKHRLNEDPLEHIGEQDITAHVNFSDLHLWGKETGLSTAGFTSQGAFLMSLGIHEEMEKIAAARKDYVFELARIKRLIMPGGMGESHMVMAQYKGKGNPELKGFSIRNSIRHL